MSEEYVSISSGVWDYSRDSAVQVGFYAELETGSLPGRRFSTHFCRQVVHLMQDSFIFSVDIVSL